MAFGPVEVLHQVDIDVRPGEVHAVLGENGAGKSTAIKIIAGDYARDGGEIRIDGELVHITSPRDAEAHGIRVIYQEFMDAPALSVAENISLGHLPRRRGLVDWPALRRRAQDILGQLGVEIDVRRPVADLSVAERQVVEIARSLAADARLLVLDEPTSALAADEVDRLFEFIHRLRAQGVAVIYITHRLDEVDRLADDVTVFRDGRVVASGHKEDFDRERIVEAMVGETLQAFSRRRVRPQAEVEQAHEPEALRVDDLAVAGRFEGVSFAVRPGEIVSLFGRLGCGAGDVAEALFGLLTVAAGRVELGGEPVRPTSPHQARELGIGFVPVDRKTEGIFADLSVAENLTVSSWARLQRRGVLPPRAVDREFRSWQDRLSIRAPGGPKQALGTLSGGNQQKVVLGRWLARDTRVLILAEPTRGVDVGARAEIYRLLEDLTRHGVGVLVVSSDVDEVLRVSDRVLVMSRGRIVTELSREQLTQAALTTAASQTAA